MRIPLLTLILAICAVATHAQSERPFSNELKRLHVHTALLFPSQAIDETPMWSPDSRYLAANVQGKWFKLDTTAVQLQEAKWHERPISVVTKEQKFVEATQGDIDDWLKQSKPRESIVSKSGVKVELPQRELATALVLSNGKKRKTLWKTDLESCGALSVSPSGQYVAFICETNGVFVIDVDEAFASK